MNRPEKKIVMSLNHVFVHVNKEKYYEELEKYCDELEKALDSIISLLTYEFSACAYPAKDGCDKENCAECWKEYLLKDE